MSLKTSKVFNESRKTVRVSRSTGYVDFSIFRFFLFKILNSTRIRVHLNKNRYLGRILGTEYTGIATATG